MLIFGSSQKASLPEEDGGTTSLPAADSTAIFRIAVKTNLLYDLALLPNLSIEKSFGKKGDWSAVLEGEWSWWNTQNEKRYFHRVQLATVEVRKWFGQQENPLTGCYIGLYGMGGTYDIRFGKVGYLSDWSSSGGLTFGYSRALNRNWNLELGIGAGYIGGEYKRYNFDPSHDRYPWLETLDRHYFGLTKLKISLVWLIKK
jgi:hypothetical protein